MPANVLAIDTVLDVDTPVGTARAHVRRPRRRPPAAGAARARLAGTLVLGHGAGGGIEAADLVAVRSAALDAGWAVVLVEQPWRVEGRRVAPAPPRLDAAWVPLVRTLRSGRRRLPDPLVVGGRSAGARVACRTGVGLGAAGTVCLAFPLHPPGRPERSRAPELALAARPLLVVQGQRDAFGVPAEVRPALPAGAELVSVAGTHALDTAAAADAAAAAVRAFLARLAGAE